MDPIMAAIVATLGGVAAAFIKTAITANDFRNRIERLEDESLTKEYFVLFSEQNTREHNLIMEALKGKISKGGCNNV